MTPTDLSPRRRRLVRFGILVTAGAIAALALFVVAAVAPTDQSYYPRCQFHQFTGLHCPGCGMTRALHAALNGRFEQALAYNVLAPVLLPVVGLSVVRSLWGWAWGGDEVRPGRRRLPEWTPWLLFGLLLVFWVVRNVPVYPFSWLAPHELP